MELQECISTGDVDGMQRFMQENEKWNVNSCLGRDGFSLLHWACHFGALEVNTPKAYTREQLAVGPKHACLHYHLLVPAECSMCFSGLSVRCVSVG